MYQSDSQSNASLTTTTFDPDFWTLPAGSSTGPGTAGNNGNGGTNNNDSNTSFTGNYVWPSGFTPDNNPVMPSDPLEPTMKQFMTSPATDMRLISALENQAAYIQGNPGEDEDLELFYYRFVGTLLVLADHSLGPLQCSQVYTVYPSNCNVEANRAIRP